MAILEVRAAYSTHSSLRSFISALPAFETRGVELVAAVGLVSDLFGDGSDDDVEALAAAKTRVLGF